MKVREEKNCKKSPFAFMVETPVSCLSGPRFAFSHLIDITRAASI
jgi:hypothetical protein